MCRYHLASSNAITGRRLAYKEVMFYEKNWNFRDAGKNKTETLQPGNYEFPFDLILEGSMPESVEGVDHSWIMYRFKAEIGRKYQKDIIIRKPLRIVRTLDSGALELSHAMVSRFEDEFMKRHRLTCFEVCRKYVGGQDRLHNQYTHKSYSIRLCSASRFPPRSTTKRPGHGPCHDTNQGRARIYARSCVWPGFSNYCVQIRPNNSSRRVHC